MAISKTLGPIHFEDLEPHRFEDLVRDLLYDFRDWYKIEATGRSGSDDGFDARAWEKVKEITNRDDQEEDSEGSITTEGNLWQIQCKRESEIGPQKVTDILNESIDDDNPPYGYILAAPTNFSKKSYDTFRDELRKKGIMEFYLWGKAELEDMLFLPKNDRILFAFFGISLATKRRSRSTQIKFAANNKNKLLRVLSGGEQTQNIRESVLLREINDEKYPYKGEYDDFDKKPRWKEHIAYGYHPLGLMIHVKEYFAYVDTEKKEYDFAKIVDLIHRKEDSNTHDQTRYEQRNKVEDFWEHLPRKYQGKFVRDGIVFFKNMLVIDDKGDVLYDFPHIYKEFKPHYGPFDGFWDILEINNTQINLKETTYTRIKIFPDEFPEVKKGKLHEDKFIEWDKDSLRQFNAGHLNLLFDVDGKYNFLEVRDAAPVKKPTEPENAYRRGESEQEQSYTEVMYKYDTTVKEFLETQKYYSKDYIERQVGRAIKDEEKLTVYEIKRTWEFYYKRST